MKRFQFRLQRVLSLKEQRERLAEARQQQARARLDAARAECNRLEDELARTAAEGAARWREVAALGIWQASYERSAALDEMLAAARRLAEEAEKQLQEADRLRIQASLEVESLRALRAREWEDYRKETSRQRQSNLDELGLQRWRAARKAGPFGGPDTGEGGG